MSNSKGTVVHWFRKGLRIHDNPSLKYAIEHAEENNYYMRPIFLLDHTIKIKLKMSGNRIKFFRECLSQLNERLGTLDSKLYVVKGETSAEFERIFKEWNVKLLSFETDIEPFSLEREKLVAEIALKHNVKIIQKNSHTLYDLNLILTKNNGSAPLTYQKFLSVVEGIKIKDTEDIVKPISESCLPLPDSKEKSTASCYDVPTLQEFGIDDENINARIHGGEIEALKKLDTIIKKKEWIRKFEKPKSSPNSLTPSTTQLSAYLKLGCLSVRHFYNKLREVEKGSNHTKPPVSLVGQLMWREFYYAVAATTPNFDQKVGNPICIQIPWKKNEKYLTAWSNGQTGYPFVDAIMRQLKQEGWIHHLARHMVACFLTRGDLWVSWEEGQKVFEEHLIDFDWALNTGNWLWLSASAFFHQYFRVYSPVAFGKKTDKNGDYIRKYVPELKKYPTQFIYEPWKAPKSIQKTAGCMIGKDYPERIVIHEEVSKENISKMSLAYKNNKDAKEKTVKRKAN